jgi:glycosyltransferase involved in cell wall biosynthesis
MRIAHVIDSMEVGGAETLVMQMCQLQREQGHEPCVYAIAALGALGERMQKEGFAVRPNVGRHLPDATRNFYRIFKESHPDVVHLHNPTPTVYAAMAARLARVPSIISTRHSLVARPRRLIVELKYAVAASFCDWVVGVCDATTNNLKSIHTIPTRKITRVYNGAAPLLRVEKEQWPKNLFMLVYVGRLAAVKNHALLLRAFDAVLHFRPRLRLWMVGDGSERKMLESLVDDLHISTEVTFWGEQLDVAPFLSLANVFIMSSKSEGVPMALLQAFSLGVPAIVTDVGGMAEVVRLAKAGIIVPQTDLTAMGEAILRMAASSAERERFSKNAIEAFRSHFTLQAMVDAYMDLYRNTSRVRRVARTERG